MARSEKIGQALVHNPDLYLRSHNIKPKDRHQLTLLFPTSIGKRSDLRHIPNDCARSALFTARNKTKLRRNFERESLFHYNEHISIIYTGIELRAEDDEIVWLQILKYSANVPLGEPFEFSIKDLVHDVDWSKNGYNYDRARTCISRLKATEFSAVNNMAYGKSDAISLIKNYEAINDSKGKPTHYRVWIDRNLIVLFAGSTFTNHVWEVYRKLSPVARRLADYIESHGEPYPLALARFQKMCGSVDRNERSWRDTVKKACAEVTDAKIVQLVTLDVHDKICCVV